MQKNTANKKNELKPIYKPYLKGNAFSGTALKRSLRVMGVLAIFVFACVLAGGILSFNQSVLRLIINGLLVFFGCALLFNEGSNQGEGDVSFAEIALNRQNEGKEVTKEDRDVCYHPLKGFVTALAAILPFLIITVVYACIAHRQAYALGALPSWVEGYENQAEIGQALAYYHEAPALTIEDTLRVVVRFALFPFMNMLGTSYDRLYLLDKLSPLLCLIIPLFYALGYLRGPHLRALVHGNIRMARRRQNRNVRKAREQRRRQAEKKELI